MEDLIQAFLWRRGEPRPRIRRVDPEDAALVVLWTRGPVLRVALRVLAGGDVMAKTLRRLVPARRRTDVGLWALHAWVWMHRLGSPRAPLTRMQKRTRWVLDASVAATLLAQWSRLPHRLWRKAVLEKRSPLFLVTLAVATLCRDVKHPPSVRIPRQLEPPTGVSVGNIANRLREWAPPTQDAFWDPLVYITRSLTLARVRHSHPLDENHDAQQLAWNGVRLMMTTGGTPGCLPGEKALEEARRPAARCCTHYQEIGSTYLGILRHARSTGVPSFVFVYTYEYPVDADARRKHKVEDARTLSGYTGSHFVLLGPFPCPVDNAESTDLPPQRVSLDFARLYFATQLALAVLPNWAWLPSVARVNHRFLHIKDGAYFIVQDMHDRVHDRMLLGVFWRVVLWALERYALPDASRWESGQDMRIGYREGGDCHPLTVFIIKYMRQARRLTLKLDVEEHLLPTHYARFLNPQQRHRLGIMLQAACEGLLPTKNTAPWPGLGRPIPACVHDTGFVVRLCVARVQLDAGTDPIRWSGTHSDKAFAHHWGINTA